MKASVCLVCLKTSEDDPTSDWSCGPPLLNKFFKFSQNYLKISAVTTKELLRSLSDDESGGELTFCEKCELSVITPICQVYLQLLSTRLRLSWELEQLNKLLKNSNFISDSLADELGVNNISQLEGFRKLLTEKCQLKRREVMPSVLAKRLIMTPRLLEFGLHEEVLDNLAGVLESGSDCSEEVPSKSLELYDDQDDDDANEDGGAFDPLSLDGFDSRDLPCNSGDDEPGLVGSLETTTNVDRHEIEASVIKLEFNRPPNTQPLFENEDNDGSRDNEEFMFLSDPPSNPEPNQSQSGLYKQKCQSCVKVFDTDHGLQAHYDYHHQRYTCAPCGKIYAGKKYFQRHITGSHQKQGSYQCQRCEKCFPTKPKLSAHINRAHNGRLHICIHCSMSFKTTSNLKRHVETLHSTKTYICEYCERVFPYKGYLKKHIERCHTSVKGSCDPPWV